MSEDVARAVGAGINCDVTIAGKVCRLRPLTIKELAEIERDAVSSYRRAYIRAYSENLDFFPEPQRSKIIRDKIEEIAKWDVTDLPAKSVVDPLKIVISDSLKKWAEVNLGVQLDDDRAVQRQVSVAIDQKLLSDELYENLTGETPKRVSVSYPHWWMSTYDGMISMLTACFSPLGISKEQIIEEMRNNTGFLSQVSRQIEELSLPALGNG